MIALLLAACSPGPAPWTDDELALLSTLSPIPPPGASPGNPFADDPAAAALGRDLFFDEGLGDAGVSCATCHRPELWFTDGLTVARGALRGERNTPTVLGAPHQTWLTWDGRKDSVWSHALEPLESPAEHAGSRVGVVRRLLAAHRDRYEAAFGELPPASWLDGLPAHARPVPDAPEHPHHVAWTALAEADRRRVNDVFVNAGRALEAWQRTLHPEPSPFDLYVQELLAGDPEGGGHLEAGARRGLRWFVGEGRCVTCHSGPWLTDREFHRLGAGSGGRAEGVQRLLADPFRCGAEDPGADCPELRHLLPPGEQPAGAFRTPTLRNVARTAPYHHDGRLRTLDEVLAFYRELPTPEAQADPLLSSIDRDVPRADVIDLLDALTSPVPPAEGR